MTSIVFESWT